ncbi:hypothetical protein E2C01_004995 [Portunus trituberculatus]|uniref:Uncharacterized protein n=1 Tax=Portunus trituberculatus TaxID=210409 RepID=A0A5B7CT33_PORTR|nr:hypothetical protein [Portunus trituberculatus]
MLGGNVVPCCRCTSQFHDVFIKPVCGNNHLIWLVTSPDLSSCSKYRISGLPRDKGGVWLSALGGCRHMLGHHLAGLSLSRRLILGFTLWVWKRRRMQVNIGEIAEG